MQEREKQRCTRRGWLCSTIGRKQLIGVTGLGLSLFLLAHLIGNLLILVGAREYNEYSHALVSNHLIYFAEIGLLAMFVIHLFLAIRISIKNRCARDSRYAVGASGPKRTSSIQKTLWAQGLLILVFAILHLITFKYGAHYTVNYGQGEIRDLYKLVIEVFHEPGYVLWYAVALVVLGFHLSHGVGSSFRTLGLTNPRHLKMIRSFSVFYAVIITVGFLSLPVYVYFIYQG